MNILQGLLFAVSPLFHFFGNSQKCCKGSDLFLTAGFKASGFCNNVQNFNTFFSETALFERFSNFHIDRIFFAIQIINGPNVPKKGLR